MPIIALGVFDKDVDAVGSLRYPSLFTPGIENKFFNRKLFAFSAIHGLFSSLVLAGVPMGTFKVCSITFECFQKVTTHIYAIH